MTNKMEGECPHESGDVIQLTKLDGSPVVVNLEAVKYFDSIPNTRVLFLNGDSLIVQETLDDIVTRSTSFRAEVLSRP